MTDPYNGSRMRIRNRRSGLVHSYLWWDETRGIVPLLTGCSVKIVWGGRRWRATHEPITCKRGCK